MATPVYRYPGEHTYKGTVYHGGCPGTVLRFIEDDLVLPENLVVVATFPKSGTTWTLEMLFQLQYGAECDRAAIGGVAGVYPMLELQMEGCDAIENIQTGTAFKGIKSHLDARFFKRQLDDPNCSVKFVTVFRNPKDSFVSLFHFCKANKFFNLDIGFNGFFEMFRHDKLVFGNSIDHMLSWWPYRHHPRVKILIYEDMLKDQPANIKNLADFLGYDISEDRVSQIAKESSMAAMRQRGAQEYLAVPPNYIRENLSPFFRKGQEGSWRESLSREQSSYMDDLIREKLHPLGLYLHE